MAIFSNVNVGTAPNDGTGDSLRTSFTKVNENFQDILAIWPNVSENEIFANITSTYVSTFNLVEAETLSSNVLTSDSKNVEITDANLTISDGYLTVFGNISGTSSNLLSINHTVKSPSGNSLSTTINGGGDTYEFKLNTTDSVGSTVAYTITQGTTVTGTLNATITAGIERTYIIFNPGPSTSSLVLPFYANRTNINNATVEISGDTTAFVIVRTVSTDIGNVFVQVANI
jgi:hypothetical protein